MSARVRVTVDDDGAVAIKLAATPADLDRLRTEAERLAHADHPGLVTLLGHDTTTDEAELRTRFAGESITRWHGSLEGVAGVGAAVASTLADLHAIGLVHGRLDASHVLVGVDGRPRLCGLSGRAGATPADDVADLAQMLAALAEQATPGRRRRSGAIRRALRDVLDDASDPVDTRRPSARAFADTLASIPGAALPRASEGSVEPGAPPVVSDDAYNGAHDPDLDDAHVTAVPPALPDAEPPDAASVFDEFWEPASELVPFDPDFWAGDEPIGPDERVVDGAGIREAPEGTHPAPDADTTAERPLLAGRQTTPPRPGAPPPPVPRRRSSRPTRLAVGVGVVAGLAVLGAIAAFAVGPRPAPTEASGPLTSTTSPVPIAERTDCEPVVQPAADVNGDGCAEAISVEDRTVTAGDARWSLGEPGDLVAVGDWDCGGDATPAVLRPSTGEVFVFPGWARPEDPVTITATETVSDAIGISARRDGACDRITVELAAGGTATVQVSEVSR